MLIYVSTELSCNPSSLLHSSTTETVQWSVRSITQPQSKKSKVASSILQRETREITQGSVTWLPAAFVICLKFLYLYIPKEKSYFSKQTNKQKAVHSNAKCPTSIVPGPGKAVPSSYTVHSSSTRHQAVSVMASLSHVRLKPVTHTSKSKTVICPKRILAISSVQV